MSNITFKTIEEELDYYKSKNSSLEEELIETQNELEEFQSFSREYEAELVKELEVSEKQLSELKTKNELLKNEVEEWKTKYYQAKTEYNVATTQMQGELDSLRNVKEKFIIRTRELELDNDDLERNERAAISSLQDLENKYNKAIERSAILENEIETKSNLIVEVQRLKDELRDVNIELAIMKNKEDGELGPPTTSSVQETQSVQSVQEVQKAQEQVAQAQSSIVSEEIPKVSPPKREMPRISGCPKSTKHIKTVEQPIKSVEQNDKATNPVKMVQEMVNRVKSLEARLVSCRSLVTPLLAPPPSYSPPHSPKCLGQPQKRTSIKSRPPSINKAKGFSLPTSQFSLPTSQFSLPAANIIG